MAEQTPNYTEQEQQEPLIPPQYLLIIAAAALVVALIVGMTQPVFGVVGYGALALSALALIAWVFMAPDQARAALTGRTARYGGLSIFVTLLILVAMVFVYILVRNAELRIDLTERDTFSLSNASTDAIETYAADPTLPPVRLLGFYGVADSRRDQDAVLFEDYMATSNGKISYEFIDPDRNPGVASLYGVTRPGQIVVVKADESGQPIINTNEQGQQIPEDFELVNFFSQDELTNAILKVSAEGDFRVYVMNVEGGVTTTPSEFGSMTELATVMTDQFDWDVQTVNFIDLVRADSEITLNDPGVDGEIMMIVGGTRPLSEREMEVLTNYVNDGGTLLLFAGSSLNSDGESLASSENLSQFLFDNFGLRFRDDVIIDPVQYIQSPLLTVTVDLNLEHPITSNGLMGRQAALVFDAAQSIEIADTPPENVEVTVLANSSEASYSESDLTALREGSIEQTDADIAGPLPVAAVAQNTQTGGSVVLFGSTSLVQDAFTSLQQGGVSNLQVAFNSLLWATDFNEFFQRTNIVSEMNVVDTPIFADAQTLRMINFVSVLLLPFGVLAIGVLVWWNNRERSRTR